MTSIEDTLIETYGPLLSMAQLANVLKRSPEGLRIALRKPQAWTEQMNAAKLKIGRRIYFRTTEIAAVLNGETWGA